MIIKLFEIEHAIKKQELQTVEIFAKSGWYSALLSRLLIILLKDCLISFELNIVANFNDFAINYFCLDAEQTTKRKIILVNFGAEIDMENFFRRNRKQIENTFIIHDSPYVHLRNFSSKRIFVLNLNQAFLRKIRKTTNYSEERLKKVKSESDLFEALSGGIFKIIKKKNLESIWFRIIYISYLYLTKIITLSTNNKEMRSIYKRLTFLSKKTNKEKHLNQRNIEKIEEIPIFLLCDWNLLEALITNQYIGSQFKIWKKNGIKKLSKFFFRLNITLKEATEAWIFLSSEKKRHFISYFERESLKFGLNFRKFTSYKQHFSAENFYLHKNRNEISACDYFLSIESINDSKLSSNNGKDKKKFWNVIKSVDCYKNIKKGIVMSQKIQKFVSLMSRIILCNKLYIKERYINYVYIRNAKNLNMTNVFLDKLSHYLAEAFVVGKEKKIIIVFLFFCQKTLVKGLFPRPSISMNRKKNQELKQKLVNFGCSFDQENRFLLEIDPSDHTNFHKLLK